jgi:hypothetical protein
MSYTLLKKKKKNKRSWHDDQNLAAGTQTTTKTSLEICANKAMLSARPL